jgi:hypothetical protein
MDQREAFLSPFEQTPDPSSRFVVVLIRVVYAGATASPCETASPISLGVRCAVDLGISIGHGRSGN